MRDAAWTIDWRTLVDRVERSGAKILLPSGEEKTVCIPRNTIERNSDYRMHFYIKMQIVKLLISNEKKIISIIIFVKIKNREAV